MRKALVIIVAVALLGTLAAYVKPAGGSSQASTDTGTAKSLETAANTTPSTSSVNNQPRTGAPGNSSSDISSSATSSTPYKDGTYKGSDVSNRYGDVQVSVKIANGKITAVTFDQLDANDQHSRQINSYASLTLVSQTISTQTASISGVSGATYTSDSYVQSLQSALDKAQA